MKNLQAAFRNFMFPVLGLFLAFAVSSINFNDDLKIPVAPAVIGQAVQSVLPDEDSTSEVFSNPVPIIWRAEVLGCLVSCGGYVLKRLDDRGETFQAYNADGERRDLRGIIEVKGLWVGMDCGYANTVFAGDCVPSVVATEINQL